MNDELHPHRLSRNLRTPNLVHACRFKVVYHLRELAKAKDNSNFKFCRGASQGSVSLHSLHPSVTNPQPSKGNQMGFAV